jgi:undecaprenyl-diphosphatase
MGNAFQQLLAWVRRAPRVATLMVVVGLVGFGFFLNIIEDVLTGDSAAVDRLLLRRGHLLATSPDGQWMTPAAKGLSLLGNWQAIVPLGLFLLFLAWRHRNRGRPVWRAFWFYVLGCAGSGALILLFKNLVNRPRPTIVPQLEKASFASFPSGHSTYALVAWGFAAWLIVRRPATPMWIKIVVIVATVALVGMIGLSRVYLGAHYPSDVAGGLLIGVPWLLAVLWFFETGAAGRGGQVRAAAPRVKTNAS